MKWNRLFSKLKIPDVETSYTWETPAFPPTGIPQNKKYSLSEQVGRQHMLCMCITFSQVPSSKMEFRTPLALKTL